MDYYGADGLLYCGKCQTLKEAKLMGLIHKSGIEINRKVLADLALNNPAAFKAVVDKVKNA